MRKIVLATKNTGKIAEFERLLSQFTPDVKVLGLADFPDMPEVIESGSTLHENARLKAKAICDFSKLPALADDSGLFIDALGGAPGIYSARWAGYEGMDTKMKDLANINKVLEELKDVYVLAYAACAGDKGWQKKVIDAKEKRKGALK